MYQEPFSLLLAPPRFPRWSGVLCRTLLTFLLLGVCVQCAPMQQSGQTQGQPQARKSMTQTPPSSDIPKKAEVAAPASSFSPEEILERFNFSVDRG